MGITAEYQSAFTSSFQEFFGNAKDIGWELYHLSSEPENDSPSWLTFTIRNPLGGRALVFRYHRLENKFYAHLKVQVIPGEENWSLDQLFHKKGYTDLDADDILSSGGEWIFHSLARHYFGIIISFCPRILEPDYFLD
ncbi:hypothetical protein ACO2KH_04785 [Leptospira terpstrae]|uniref:hypothetical protein n=1 Tax=Leptospira terpstrae TaxID=293075 RepID=UPI003D019499